MKFKQQNLDFVKNRISFLLQNPKVCSMKGYVQHGDVSTYEHCINVATMSYILAKNLPFAINMEEMLVGAILHDFYLYDWHDGRIRKEGLHCMSHPKIALENAEKYFHLTTKERNIIRSHMFPATLCHFPTCKEAAVVCMADKICAFVETFEIGFLNGMWMFLFQRKRFSQKRGQL